MKPKMGRPKLPKGQAKGTLFAVRVANDEARTILGAVKRSGVPKPQCLRNALISAAKTE